MVDQSGKMRSPYVNSEPEMDVKIKGLEGEIFYYGKGMQSKCISSSKAFIDYVGRTYGESEKQSVEANRLVITDMDEPKDIETEEEFKNMTFKEQKMWEKQADVWFKTTAIVNKNLSKAYSVLWSICHSGLQQKIKSDKDFQAMKEGDVGELFRIVQKICHGNSSTDNPFTNLVEATYNFLMIKGDSYDALALYLETFEKKFEVMDKCGFTVISPGFRDLYMKELSSRDKESSAMYQLLDAWKTEDDWVSTMKGEKAPTSARIAAQEALVEQFKAHIYIKRAGARYEYYRNNLHNNYNEGIALYPSDITTAHHIMDHHKSVQPMKTGDSTKESKAQTYEQEGFTKAHDPANVPGSEQESGAPTGFRFKPGCFCFKCDREGHMTRECWFDTKEDGSPLNTAKEIDKRYQEKEQARRKSRRGTQPSIQATQNFVMTEDYCRTESMQPMQSIALDIRKLERVYNQEGRCLKPYEVLLDSCSTCDIFVNADFLRNIRRCQWKLSLKTQAGDCEVTMIGDLPGVGTVWYYSEGSANILSLHRMVTQSGWSVKYNTDRYHETFDPDDLCYHCVTKEGINVSFAPTRMGLYVMNCDAMFHHKKRANVFGDVLIDNSFGVALCHNNEAAEAIDTIDKSRKRFSKRDQIKADMARRFQHIAGHPSDATMIYAAATNSIKNSPITRRHVEIAKEMLGRSKYALQGKTTRTQPAAVTDSVVDVPSTVLEFYKDVELSVDIMHVNKVVFLVTISKHIHYATVNPIDDMKMPTLEATLKRVFKMYTVRGFNITTIHVDIQFKAIKDRGLLDPTVNVVSRDEHVPEVERLIRVIKERARCYFAMLPYNRLPRMMIIHLMITVIFYINAFVWQPGVSQFLSPTTIIEGIALDYNKHFHVIFGEYVHTYEGTTNTPKLRTVGAIALGPSGNLQGGIRCYSLLSGHILHRTIEDITRLKMPEDAIRRINYIARKQKSKTGLQFGDRHNTLDNDNSITGVDNNTTPQIDAIAQPNHPLNADIMLETPEHDGPNDDGNTTIEEDLPAPTQQEDPQEEEKEEDEIEQEEDEEIEQTEQEEEDEIEQTELEEDSHSDSIAPENRADEIPPPELNDLTTESEDDDDEGGVRTRSGRMSQAYDFESKFPDIYRDNNLIEEHHKRVRRMAKEEYNLYAEALSWCEYEPRDVEALVYKTKQMSVKEGIRRHGSQGKASAMKEVTNLVENDCFGETVYEDLTQEMKDKALPILMFMVMKRNGLLKTRGVADGSVQRLYTDKDSVSSPTPDFYSFKYVCAVIAKEGRDVATVDLPGFFLQTDQEGEELILLKLTGEVALLLVECDENKWKKHLREENGRPVIYVICKKAIYGTMNAALLAYKKLANLFKDWGLEMNPYDPCVWNKVIDGNQFTVVFHVDDLLMSHRSPKVVTDIISKLDDEYGSKDELTVTRGPVHEYLGMTVDFRVQGECAFSQYDYIKKLLNSIPSSLVSAYRNTPAPEHLFKVDIDSPPLDKERYNEYHTIVAKILWASQRSRPDIQLATGFHCTRVKEASEQDWMKLGHLIGYIRKTRFIPLIIATNDNGTIIYIDGAHAVHADARGHSGLFVTQGKGAMINVSKKLGVATTSSTETEIVSTGERLPKCTWFRYFRIAQGEKESEDILKQDNKSAIVLQSRYPYSTRKGSKHIHVRYFFAVDKLNRKEIRIEHCPTEDMIADYNSKPLQGKAFIVFRNIIMGVDEESFLMYKHRYVEVLKQYELFDEAESDLLDL